MNWEPGFESDFQTIADRQPSMSTVLVVDDSSFSRGRVIAALKPLVLRIITDLLMPTLDGFGLLRGLRERGSSTPVIVVSADIQTSSRRMCQELGAAGFLNKPFHAQELSDLVQQLLPAIAEV
jgi:CheY-like chemotaxis protein